MANKGTEIQIGDGSLHIGDRVVYPNQGICRITGVEVRQIAGRDWEVVTLAREEDGATVMVPRSKVMEIGLRKVASVEAIDTMFDQLAAPSDDPQLDWKVRHRENADRMTGGGLQGTLDVLKGLHALSQVRPLPQKERELYDNARHLLVGEIAAAMNLPLHVAEDNLDYALWPPAGMKRKGKTLPPATLGPPSPARAAVDDLGFDDEQLGAEETTTAAAPAAQESDDDEEEKEAAVPAAAKKTAAEKPKTAHKPEHAPPRREKPAPAAAKKAKTAHAPAKKPAAAKKAAARKPAPKTPARKPAAKRPVAKAKAKAKR